MQFTNSHSIAIYGTFLLQNELVMHVSINKQLVSCQNCFGVVDAKVKRRFIVLSVSAGGFGGPVLEKVPHIELKRLDFVR